MDSVQIDERKGLMIMLTMLVHSSTMSEPQ